MKKTNGITLIALVITIIVLLILAGISISMLSGDNSILSRASEAKNQTNEKSLKEEVQVAVSGRLIEKKTTGTNAKTLEEELREKISNADEITAASLGACYVKRDNTELTVYDSGEIEDGKFEIWDGSTVECPEFKKENNIWNWYIYKPSQLKFLADFVNDENKGGTSVPDNLRSMVTNAGYNAEEITMTIDTTIYLMNNLDMGARQTNGTKTTGTDWTPIGVATINVGTFEGNNYTIIGVYVNRDANYCGLFGYSNKIQNVTIKDSYIKGKNAVGGIVSYPLNDIENCHNKNTSVYGFRKSSRRNSRIDTKKYKKMYQ